MSFPRPTQMFQFRRFPSYTYLIQYRIPFGGFPHSEISGSQDICSSPKLIAAYHVLHRLLMPRHSPCALFSLIFFRSTQQKSPFGSLLVELCRLIFQKFILAKIVFYPIFNKFPFMLPSHNCIIVTMFSFQGTSSSFLRNSMKFRFPGTSVNLLKEVVGQNGLEPSTSRLSVVCSSQLSYWPISASLLFGGDQRDRTADLLLARQALSQLS